MNEPTNIHFGLDLGMGANKLHGPSGGLALPSLVAVETGQAVSNLLGFRQQKPPLRVSFGGAAYFVGPNAHDWGRPVENLSYERMTGVPETRALVCGSFTRYSQQYGPITAPVSLVVGLPLEPLTGPDAQTNIEAARAWLVGAHRWEADGQSYALHVAEAKITSQPSGAFFDYLLDEDGQIRPERKAALSQEIGVISIGHNTVEILALRDRAPVPGMTAGRTSGVRRLLELLNQEGLYTLGELDTRLRANRLDVRPALPAWASEVNGLIERTWGNRWKRFGQIIVVGGGALLLREQLIERFNGRVHIPDDPVMAIARGLHKLAVQQAHRRSR
jgi:hypothetical protein